MSSDKTLKAIFEGLLESGLIRPSRVGPIRTAVKQYAQILGYPDAAECPTNAYLKSDAIRNKLVDEKAPHSLGVNGVRNLKNNLSYILRKAIEIGLISPFAAELASWRESNSIKFMPRRNESKHPNKYTIDPIPKLLEEEIAEYEKWSTKVSNRLRPKSLKKRPISFFHHRKTLLREAGYLVKFKGLVPDSITLLTLIVPTNAIDYVEWCVELQGRHTAGSCCVLSRILSLASYLEIALEDSTQKAKIHQWIVDLRKFKASLGTPVKVQSKDRRWLTLNQLEMVGRSIYPLNARRVQELAHVTRTNLDRYLAPQHAPDRSFRRYATYVRHSLLIRLVVRIPFRQRNLREMCWSPNSVEQGQNLYKKDGVWRLKFRGDELKIAQVNGEVHSVEFDFPPDLVGLLEEWLNKWRPSLIASQKAEYKGKEHQPNGQELVFLNLQGGPLMLRQLTMSFERATYKFTGVAVNPHMFRTIFATEFIKETNNFIDAAYMLGDTVKTVIDRYAKLLDEDCGKRAYAWISRKLQVETSDTNGNGHQSPFPKLQYPRGR